MLEGSMQLGLRMPEALATLRRIAKQAASLGCCLLLGSSCCRLPCGVCSRVLGSCALRSGALVGARLGSGGPLGSGWLGDHGVILAVGPAGRCNGPAVTIICRCRRAVAAVQGHVASHPCCNHSSNNIAT